MTHQNRAFATILLLAVLAAACSPGGGNAQTSPTDQDAALAALGLIEGERISWQSRTVDSDRVRFEGFTLTDPDGVLQVDTLVVDQPRLSEQGPLVDALSFEAAVITYPDGEARFDSFSVQNPGPGLVEAAAALFQGRERVLNEDAPGEQSFDSLSVTNLIVEGETEDGQPLNLGLGALTANRFDGDALGRFVLTQLALETQNDAGHAVTFSLDQVEAEGFASGLVNVSAARPFSGGLNIGEAYDRFVVEGLSLNAAGLRVEMPQMQGNTETRSGAVVAATISMPELVVFAEPDAGDLGQQLAGGLQQMGFEQLSFSLQSTTVYDPEADQVRTEGENALALDGGFRLAVEQDFSGVAAYAEAYAAWLEESRETDPTSVPADVLDLLKLNRFVMELQDVALLDSLFATAAAERGTTPDTVRGQTAMLVVFASAFAGGVVETALLQDAQAAVASFISAGGTLTISVDPASPLSMADFTNGDPIRAEQGVSVSHTPPEE